MKFLVDFFANFMDETHKKFLKSIPGKIPSIKPGLTGVNVLESIECLEELLA